MSRYNYGANNKASPVDCVVKGSPRACYFTGETPSYLTANGLNINASCLNTTGGIMLFKAIKGAVATKSASAVIAAAARENQVPTTSFNFLTSNDHFTLTQPNNMMYLLSETLITSQDPVVTFCTYLRAIEDSCVNEFGQMQLFNSPTTDIPRLLASAVTNTEFGGLAVVQGALGDYLDRVFGIESYDLEDAFMLSDLKFDLSAIIKLKEGKTSNNSFSNRNKGAGNSHHTKYRLEGGRKIDCSICSKSGHDYTVCIANPGNRIKHTYGFMDPVVVPSKSFLDTVVQENRPNIIYDLFLITHPDLNSKPLPYFLCLAPADFISWAISSRYFATISGRTWSSAKSLQATINTYIGERLSENDVGLLKRAASALSQHMRKGTTGTRDYLNEAVKACRKIVIKVDLSEILTGSPQGEYGPFIKPTIYKPGPQINAIDSRTFSSVIKTPPAPAINNRGGSTSDGGSNRRRVLLDNLNDFPPVDPKDRKAISGVDQPDLSDGSTASSGPLPISKKKASRQKYLQKRKEQAAAKRATLSADNSTQEQSDLEKALIASKKDVINKNSDTESSDLEKALAASKSENISVDLILQAALTLSKEEAERKEQAAKEIARLEEEELNATIDRSKIETKLDAESVGLKPISGYKLRVPQPGVKTDANQHINAGAPLPTNPVPEPLPQRQQPVTVPANSEKENVEEKQQDTVNGDVKAPLKETAEDSDSTQQLTCESPLTETTILDSDEDSIKDIGNTNITGDDSTDKIQPGVPNVSQDPVPTLILEMPTADINKIETVAKQDDKGNMETTSEVKENHTSDIPTPTENTNLVQPSPNPTPQAPALVLNTKDSVDNTVDTGVSEGNNDPKSNIYPVSHPPVTISPILKYMSAIKAHVLRLIGEKKFEDTNHLPRQYDCWNPCTESAVTLENNKAEYDAVVAKIYYMIFTLNYNQAYTGYTDCDTHPALKPFYAINSHFTVVSEEYMEFLVTLNHMVPSYIPAHTALALHYSSYDVRSAIAMLDTARTQYPCDISIKYYLCAFGIRSNNLIPKADVAAVAQICVQELHQLEAIAPNCHASGLLRADMDAYNNSIPLPPMPILDLHSTAAFIGAFPYCICPYTGQTTILGLEPASAALRIAEIRAIPHKIRINPLQCDNSQNVANIQTVGLLTTVDSRGDEQVHKPILDENASAKEKEEACATPHSAPEESPKQDLNALQKETEIQEPLEILGKEDSVEPVLQESAVKSQEEQDQKLESERSAKLASEQSARDNDARLQREVEAREDAERILHRQAMLDAVHLDIRNARQNFEDKVEAKRLADKLTAKILIDKERAARIKTYEKDFYAKEVKLNVGVASTAAETKASEDPDLSCDDNAPATVHQPAPTIDTQEVSVPADIPVFDCNVPPPIITGPFTSAGVPCSTNVDPPMASIYKSAECEQTEEDDKPCMVSFINGRCHMDELFNWDGYTLFVRHIKDFKREDDVNKWYQSFGYANYESYLGAPQAVNIAALVTFNMIDVKHYRKQTVNLPCVKNFHGSPYTIPSGVQYQAGPHISTSSMLAAVASSNPSKWVKPLALCGKICSFCTNGYFDDSFRNAVDKFNTTQPEVQQQGKMNFKKQAQPPGGSLFTRGCDYIASIGNSLIQTFKNMFTTLLTREFKALAVCILLVAFTMSMSGVDAAEIDSSGTFGHTPSVPIDARKTLFGSELVAKSVSYSIDWFNDADLSKHAKFPKYTYNVIEGFSEDFYQSYWGSLMTVAFWLMFMIHTRGQPHINNNVANAVPPGSTLASFIALFVFTASFGFLWNFFGLVSLFDILPGYSRIFLTSATFITNVAGAHFIPTLYNTIGLPFCAALIVNLGRYNNLKNYTLPSVQPVPYTAEKISDDFEKVMEKLVFDLPPVDKKLIPENITLEYFDINDDNITDYATPNASKIIDSVLTSLYKLGDSVTHYWPGSCFSVTRNGDGYEQHTSQYAQCGIDSNNTFYINSWNGSHFFNKNCSVSYPRLNPLEFITVLESDQLCNNRKIPLEVTLKANAESYYVKYFHSSPVYRDGKIVLPSNIPVPDDIKHLFISSPFGFANKRVDCEAEDYLGYFSLDPFSGEPWHVVVYDVPIGAYHLSICNGVNHTSTPIWRVVDGWYTDGVHRAIRIPGIASYDKPVSDVNIFGCENGLFYYNISLLEQYVTIPEAAAILFALLLFIGGVAPSFAQTFCLASSLLYVIFYTFSFSESFNTGYITKSVISLFADVHTATFLAPILGAYVGTTLYNNLVADPTMYNNRPKPVFLYVAIIGLYTLHTVTGSTNLIYYLVVAFVALFSSLYLYVRFGQKNLFITRSDAMNTINSIEPGTVYHNTLRLLVDNASTVYPADLSNKLSYAGMAWSYIVGGVKPLYAAYAYTLRLESATGNHNQVQMPELDYIIKCIGSVVSPLNIHCQSFTYEGYKIYPRHVFGTLQQTRSLASCSLIKVKDDITPSYTGKIGLPNTDVTAYLPLGTGDYLKCALSPLGVHTASTAPGYCGLPLIWIDNGVPTVAGLHMGGFQKKNGNSQLALNFVVDIHTGLTGNNVDPDDEALMQERMAKLWIPIDYVSVFFAAMTKAQGRLTQSGLRPLTTEAQLLLSISFNDDKAMDAARRCGCSPNLVVLACSAMRSIVAGYAYQGNDFVKLYCSQITEPYTFKLPFNNFGPTVPTAEPVYTTEAAINIPPGILPDYKIFSIVVSLYQVAQLSTLNMLEYALHYIGLGAYARSSALFIYSSMLILGLYGTYKFITDLYNFTFKLVDKVNAIKQEKEAEAKKAAPSDKLPLIDVSSVKKAAFKVENAAAEIPPIREWIRPPTFSLDTITPEASVLEWDNPPAFRLSVTKDIDSPAGITWVNYLRTTLQTLVTITRTVVPEFKLKTEFPEIFYDIEDVLTCAGSVVDEVIAALQTSDMYIVTESKMSFLEDEVIERMCKAVNHSWPRYLQSSAIGYATEASTDSTEEIAQAYEELKTSLQPIKPYQSMNYQEVIDWIEGLKTTYNLLPIETHPKVLHTIHSLALKSLPKENTAPLETLLNFYLEKKAIMKARNKEASEQARLAKAQKIAQKKHDLEIASFNAQLTASQSRARRVAMLIDLANHVKSSLPNVCVIDKPVKKLLGVKPTPVSGTVSYMIDSEGFSNTFSRNFQIKGRRIYVGPSVVAVNEPKSKWTEPCGGGWYCEPGKAIADFNIIKDFCIDHPTDAFKQELAQKQVPVLTSEAATAKNEIPTTDKNEMLEMIKTLIQAEYGKASLEAQRKEQVDQVNNVCAGLLKSGQKIQIVEDPKLHLVDVTSATTDAEKPSSSFLVN